MRTRSSTEQRAGLMDGTYDLGLTAIDNLIAWDADGDDLVVVAQVERTTVLDLCAAPDVGAIAELRGRTLAVDAVDTGFAILLRHVLATHGLAPDDYELLPAGGIQQRMEAIVEGRAAAGLLGPPFNQIALGRGCRVLAHAHEEVPRLPGIGAVIRASATPATMGAAHAYVRALAEAAAWATDDREEEAVRDARGRGLRSRGGGAAVRHPRANGRPRRRRHRAALRDAPRPRDAAFGRAPGRGARSTDGMRRRG